MGCSKSKSPEAPEQPTPPDPIVVPPAPSVGAKLIPMKLEAPGQTIQFNYQANSSRLSSVSDSKGMKITMLYKDELLTGYLLEDKTEAFMNDIWRDVNKRINRVSRYQEKTNIIPGGEFQIDYDDHEHFSEVRHYSARNVLLSSWLFKYDADENLTQMDGDEGGKKTQQLFKYDLKSGMFRNVTAVKLLFLETDLDLFASSAHNLVSRSGPQEATYAYTYRPDDFPETITVVVNNVKTTFKVSYKTF